MHFKCCQKIVRVFQKFLSFSEYMNFMYVGKVKTLWEGHKIRRNIPLLLIKKLFLLSSVKTSGIFFQFLWPTRKSWTLRFHELFHPLKILSLTSMWLRFLGNRPVPWMYWSLLVSNLTSVRASMPSKAPSSRVSMSQWDRAKVVTKRKWLKAPLLQKKW